MCSTILWLYLPFTQLFFFTLRRRSYVGSLSTKLRLIMLSASRLWCIKASPTPNVWLVCDPLVFLHWSCRSSTDGHVGKGSHFGHTLGVGDALMHQRGLANSIRWEVSPDSGFLGRFGLAIFVSHFFVGPCLKWDPHKTPSLASACKIPRARICLTRRKKLTTFFRFPLFAELVCRNVTAPYRLPIVQGQCFPNQPRFFPHAAFVTQRDMLRWPGGILLGESRGSGQISLSPQR